MMEIKESKWEEEQIKKEIKMKKWLIIIVSVILLGFSGQNASATLINFDDIASGTDISTRYSGVTFSAILCPGLAATCGASTNPVYAVASTHAVSPGNVVSISSTVDAFGTDYGGVIEATFSALQSSVSITTEPWIQLSEGFDAYGKPYISAFDSADNFLGITYYSGVINPTLPLPANGIETLTILGAGNIHKVRFTVQSKSPHTLASFDNLVFGSGTSVNPLAGGTPVPEPSTLLLLGSGLLGFGFFARKRIKG